MYLHGTFTNINGNRVTVEIVAGGDRKDEVAIAETEEQSASADTKVWFSADNTAQVETRCDDILTHIMEGRATVTLLTRDILQPLFQANAHDTTVLISVDGSAVFAGYLEPRVYTQDYADEANQLQLNCVDCLSALRYSYFRNIHTTADYEEERRKAGTSTLLSLVEECLDAGTSGQAGYALYYDASVLTGKGAEAGSVFSDLRVADILWLGETESDTKTHEEVLGAILQYLGLHMMQVGLSFFIFSMDSIGKKVEWTLLAGGTSVGHPTPMGEAPITLTVDELMGGRPSVDIGEVFNQVVLNISTTALGSALVSPLDSGSLAPASDRFYYMTEYAADGEGTRAARAFWNLVTQGADNGYTGGMVYKDYAVRLMRSKQWKVGQGSGPGTSPKDLSELQSQSDAQVGALAASVCASLLQVGARDYKPGKGDTNKEGRLAMSDYLVIGVNGNGEDGDNLRYPTEADIRKSIPVADYVGGSGNAMYSPADEGSHNYLVISGSVVMNPRYRAGYTAQMVRELSLDDFIDRYRAQYMAPSRGNKDGRYLCFEWWKDGQKNAQSTGGWVPYTGDGPEEYEYKSPGGFDKVDKVDVLWCMLRIGGKVLVEKKVDDDGNDLAGAIDNFSWCDYKTMETCRSEHPGDEDAAVDTYLEQTFTIGIDPVIGDHVVGEEFSIQTNFDADTGISASEGMAIPLPYADRLSGKIVFQILGPDDGYWSNYHKTRHATMFRHSRWGTDNIPLLSHLSSILVKNLEVKMYSDVTNSDSDTDLAYCSAVTHKYYNRKEVAGPMIHSGFTTAETSAFNLSGDLLASTVRDASGGALLSVYNAVTGESGKPEQLYVDEAYRWLSTPRLQVTLEMREDCFWPFCTYSVGGVTYLALGSKQSLRDGYVRVTLLDIS